MIVLLLNTERFQYYSTLVGLLVRSELFCGFVFAQSKQPSSVFSESSAVQARGEGGCTVLIVCWIVGQDRSGPDNNPTTN